MNTSLLESQTFSLEETAKFLGMTIKDLVRESKSGYEICGKMIRGKLRFYPAQLYHYYDSCFYRSSLSYRKKLLYRGSPPTPPFSFGHVYFTEAPELNRVKIGFTTKNIIQRLRSSCSESPTQINLIGKVIGTHLYEKFLHNRFRHLNIKGGDWFLKSPELMTEINKILSESDRCFIPVLCGLKYL